VAKETQMKVGRQFWTAKGPIQKGAEWQPMQKESAYSISEDVEEMEILKMVLMIM
jgi:hypothetical protein